MSAYRLWDGVKPVYLPSIPVNIKSTGSFSLKEKHLLDREKDRRIKVAYDDEGRGYLVYHSSDGFKSINLIP